MKFSLIIPLRNEAENITRLAQELPLALDALSLEDYEIIVVDDASTDDSLERLKHIHDQRFRVFNLQTWQGQSAAMAAGMKQARFEITGYIDADLQTDPADFGLMLTKLKEGYDAVVGKRVDRQDPFIRSISATVARKFRQAILGDDYYDITCPIKVWRTELLQEFTFYKTFHRFIPIFLEMNGGKVVEIAVKHRARTAGRSKYGTWKRLIAGVKSMLVIRWLRSHWVDTSIKPV